MNLLDKVIYGAGLLTIGVAIVLIASGMKEKSLEEQLREAVDEENYLKAAKLRDEIKSLKA